MVSKPLDLKVDMLASKTIDLKVDMLVSKLYKGMLNPIQTKQVNKLYILVSVFIYGCS